MNETFAQLTETSTSMSTSRLLFMVVHLAMDTVDRCISDLSFVTHSQKIDMTLGF